MTGQMPRLSLEKLSRLVLNENEPFGDLIEVLTDGRELHIAALTHKQLDSVLLLQSSDLRCDGRLANSQSARRRGEPAQLGGRMEGAKLRSIHRFYYLQTYKRYIRAIDLKLIIWSVKGVGRNSGLAVPQSGQGLLRKRCLSTTASRNRRPSLWFGDLPRRLLRRFGPRTGAAGGRANYFDR